MNVKIIGKAVVLVVYILIHFVPSKTVDKTVKNSLMQKTRGKVVKKSIKTKDADRVINPSNVFVQKMIKHHTNV